MRYDPSSPQIIWRTLMSRAMEEVEDKVHEIEKTQREFLREDDIRLIKLLVYGAAGMIIITVFGGMVAAGVLFATSGSISP